MRNEQAAVERGHKGRSQIKKELRERDKDESWKGDALKQADATEKRARPRLREACPAARPLG
jgi:hypothetical protein